MLEKIIHSALTHRVFIVLCSIVLTIYGLYSAKTADVDIFPDLNAPTVVVMTECGAMNTEDVEALVSYPIESSLSGASGIRRIRSTSTDGLSIVWAEFDWSTDVLVARQTISEKLPELSSNLPAEAGQPVMAPQSSIMGEIFIVGLRTDSTSLMDLRTAADFELRPRLMSLSGVAGVTVIGGDVKEYQIVLDELKMQHFNISINEVIESLEGVNQNVNGGLVSRNGSEYSVRCVCATKDVETLGKAFIARRGNYSVMLSDIADIKIDSRFPRIGKASIEKKDAVLLTVTKQPGASTLDLTEAIDKTLEAARPSLPADVEIRSDIFRSSDFIDRAIDNVKGSLYEGIFFVAIILALFLANARTTVISLITLPISVLTSILVLKLMNLGINTMSLGGIAIAIGSLVDDAIVDVENVWRRLSTDKKDFNIINVIEEASCEVRIPILNSTLIIMASFLPLFFLTGMEGKMLIPLGIAFITALCCSTVVALTLTPVLCSYLLKQRKEEKEKADGWVSRKLKALYTKMLESSLEHKKGILSFAFVALAVSVVGLLSFGSDFLPPFNEGSLTINISTLPGTSLEVSNEIGMEAEELLMSVPEVKTVSRKTGRAERDEHALGSNVSEIEVPFELKDRSKQEMLDEVRHKLSHIKGANIEIGQPISHRIDAMLSGSQSAIAVKIFGAELPKLEQIAGLVKEEMKEIDGLADVNSEQLTFRPQLRLTPRREMLAEYGITQKELSEFITVKMSSMEIGMVREENKSYEIKLLSKKSSSNIEDMLIPSNNGMIPLSYVCNISYTTAPSTINRENGSRRIIVSAQQDGRDLETLVSEIKSKVNEAVELPDGYWIEYSGQFESQQRATRTLMITLLISLVIIVVILKNQFTNWKLCALIMSSLPFALVGGVFSIFVSGDDLNIPAVIGFISLFGIATRGGMLLIAEYEKRERENEPLASLIITGSVSRLNPILMTALSSALALIPMIIAADKPGAEIQSPMAKVILGGLISSTILSLFIIPILYHSIKNK
ncbi:MAG: efflux RND transporter permease subunit [Paludibacteraceae bacterium]|nr:efflux RND transporter permease subunit [Paludibacteraceae bacterium]